jgi:hypothetical protein
MPPSAIQRYLVISAAFAISIVMNESSTVPEFELLSRVKGVPSVFEKSSNRTPMMTPITISAPIILFPPF